MQQNNNNEFILNEFNNNQVNTPMEQNGVSIANKMDCISNQPQILRIKEKIS